MPCTCNDIPHPPEAAQTADQYRVLSMLPMKPPTSRIQENNNGDVLHQLHFPLCLGEEARLFIQCRGHDFDEREGRAVETTIRVEYKGRETNIQWFLQLL